MKTCALLFPGQGSQRVGMSADERLLKQASSVSGVDLVRLCREGPESELAKTEFAQPAIFVASLSRFRDWQGGPVSGAAGHSLGEYSALVAAGRLEFDQALEVVAERGRAMAEAGREYPGTMAAAMADWDRIVEICGERRAAGGEIWPANQNAPGQSVVSGSEKDIQWMTENARELGIRRVIRLAVSGAFHSPYMAPAAERLERALDGVDIHPGAFPVVSNVTAEPHGDTVRELLVEQLTAPVRWIDSLEYLSKETEEFVAFGPGDTAEGLARRTLPDAVVTPA